MDEAEKTEKTEAEVLFPEVEVEGYKIRPWSFGQLAELAPIFREMSILMRREKIDLEGLFNAAERNDLQTVFDTLMLFLIYAPIVVAKTVRKPLAEIGDLAPEKALPVLLTIIMQNLERLKNLFGLGLSALTKKGMAS